MKKPLLEAVAEKLGHEVFNGASVLDVGCFRFAGSIAMRDMGARVTALDICKREEAPEGIAFVKADFLEWQPEGTFDMLYLSNSALFMPTAAVFKKIESFDARIVAVRTMYDYPKPNWDASELKPLYFTTPEDWKRHFEPLGYETAHATSYELETTDLRDRPRTFRCTEYIGVKKQSR